MTLESNGKTSVRFNLPNIGAVASIMSVVIFIGGFGSGILTMNAALTQVRDNVGDLRRQLHEVEAERQAQVVKVSNMERDISYMSKDIAQMNLKIVPK